MQKYLYDDLYNLEDVHWWHKAKRNLVSYFLAKYLPKKNNRILDFGCGTGKNLEVFSKYGTTWGIDNSPDAIKFCKKRGLKNIVREDIEKPPFQKDFFDAVTTLDVLEHVDDTKALKKIHELLNPSGVLIATVPAFSFLWSRWDEVLHHKRRYNIKTLTDILRKSGFNVIKISYTYSFLFFPALIVRTIKNILYKNYYPSDFKLSNKIINNIFGLFAKIEKIFITKYYVPFGTSLIVIARKDNL